ncbi:uncharacterized protein AC631_05349 [Debaryomyces fabryi]|uniref:Non-structural maintenance of chromosomes element 4 n=1 Tax=Debaryomyces fabryi TaxID=58627 RepID=A0A0V1PRV7_9ASCO|nr:uncharacterized protein AC631_05349 [Debaryomyces fabryi]KRZ98897.1 hypothetical protein AC631_05349 [Debaryomyces fabryi]CUM54557.1 unnamed protein product [Debaryomyces fabryi]
MGPKLEPRVEGSNIDFSSGAINNSENNGNKSSSDSSESSYDSSSDESLSDGEPARKMQKTDKNTLMNRYEFLKSKMRDENSEAHKGEATSLVLDHLRELKVIYDIVQKEHNRDTKVHLKDAEAFMDTSKFAATNAKNLKFDDMGMSLSQKDFLSHLRSYLNPNEATIEDDAYDDDDTESSTKEDTFNSYNWLKLGALYYSVSNRAVVTDSLYGPLETERKRQVTRTRNIDDTKNSLSTTAQLVQANDISGNEEQNTAHKVKNVYRTFVQKKDEAGVNFFKFFINPNSFAQSIENLFFTSFLIKDARLKLYLNEEGIPIIQTVDPQEYEVSQLNPSSGESNHHIATFDYKTWQGLIKRFNITESYLETRPEADDTYSSSDNDEDETN